MTAATFRPLFDRVCDEFGLSAEARAIAWRSCLTGEGYLVPRAVRLYTQIDRTRGPWSPSV